METKLKFKNESLGATPIEIDPEVLSVLRNLNLTELSGIFKREQLTVEDILDMNNHELQLIGVEKHKQRKAILQVILCQRHLNFYFLTQNMATTILTGFWKITYRENGLPMLKNNIYF